MTVSEFIVNCYVEKMIRDKIPISDRLMKKINKKKAKEDIKDLFFFSNAKKRLFSIYQAQMFLHNGEYDPNILKIVIQGVLDEYQYFPQSTKNILNKEYLEFKKCLDDSHLRHVIENSMKPKLMIR